MHENQVSQPFVLCLTNKHNIEWLKINMLGGVEAYKVLLGVGQRRETETQLVNNANRAFPQILIIRYHRV